MFFFSISYFPITADKGITRRGKSFNSLNWIYVFMFCLLFKNFYLLSLSVSNLWRWIPIRPNSESFSVVNSSSEKTCFSDELHLNQPASSTQEPVSDVLPGYKNLMPTFHLPCSFPPGKKARRDIFPGTSGHRSPRTGQPPRAAAAHYFCFSNLSTGEHHQLCTRITGAWRGSVTERPIMSMNNSNTYAPCSFYHW